ncbi:MAG: hypothetical protein K5696_01865 [Lachnospiraceae bacterium]|nr:hypothetical protein [Lachnospiraceae bacterium]
MREKARILRGKAGVFSYCVLLAENPNEQLEIVHSAYLFNERLKDHPVTVYGVARTRNGAFELVRRIADRAHRAGLTGNLRGYLESRRQQRCSR